MFYGLTPIEVRKLAYEMAVINNLKISQRWHDTELAGVEWYYGFRKRHPVLSLRTPEGCSLSRATAFNRYNVNNFFDNLETAMLRNESFGNGTRVFNLDETNTMTVQKSSKVLAVRGQKQVSKVTSGEKGTLVTTCYVVNALGNALPPVMIFPRVHFKQHMISGAPTGTLGLASPSGWMNSSLFVKTMQHYIDHTQSSKENRSLLIMDNYEAHICIEAINLAKENGVTILTVPPHSTGKLQPLDVAIFKPFKTAYNAAIDSWMMRNPGKSFSIYEVAQCVKEAHMKSMTPANICSAFKCTGIFPFNRDIFSDEDFAPSEITNREISQHVTLPEGEIHTSTRSTMAQPLNQPVTTSLQQRSSLTPSTSGLATDSVEIDTPTNARTLAVEMSIDNTVDTEHFEPQLLSIPPNVFNVNHATSSIPKDRPIPVLSTTSLTAKVVETDPSLDQKNIASTSARPLKIIDTQAKTFSGPFDFRGIPKAAPRKSGRAPRRKGKSMIATDTPNKEEIERRHQNKKQQQDVKKTKRKVLQSESSEEDDRQEKKNEKPTKKKRQRQRKANMRNISYSETSEESSDISIYSEEEGCDDGEEEEVIDPDNFISLEATPKEGNFVLVQFVAHKSKIFYIGKVIRRRAGTDFDITFLRKSLKVKNGYRSPDVPDIASVPLQDIKLILPPPTVGGTKRQQQVYKFNINLSNLNMR
ncbi:unnamed protein product [Callosobruchus maculatus]|uniref:DDE-1 domain-containing protein n=1 Tax=Callosobruchus maculatus TaxID=64391 RepID=A0A653BJE1_CALMS|nr:unnamed protein product [Callosobruchus maculatus]